MSAKSESDLLVKSIVETNSGVSVARALLSYLPRAKLTTRKIASIKTWWLLNTDTGETIFGPFEAEGVTENISSAYSHTFALNRQNAITQFLHGNVPTISFNATFHSSFVFLDITKKIDKIKKWVKRDSKLGRPPVIYFWIGDQHTKMKSCFISSVVVTSDRPGFLGAMKGANLAITLQKYTPFNLEDRSFHDTRYHMARLGDTYELICAREYGNPMLGVEIRDRHPKQRRLEAGDIVKLPNINGSLRRTRVQPKSLALKGILDRRDNPQKVNLKSLIETRKKARYQFTV